ncbi:MAG: LCP family protein [Lachnospiraceae bacterium]|nr:LCP family protein [Lachnospiraceae bacterium]
MSDKKKKGLSTNAKWGIALFVEILVLAMMVVLYVRVYITEKYDMVQYETIEDPGINDGANADQEGYTTIALFGIDSRSNTDMKEGNRSDSIMIASINNSTKEVKLVSVYRDSFLEIADGSGLITKVNAAYAYGGPELAVRTLNANLDLQITEFITVNFLALTKAIDQLGGITVDISEGELAVINSGITEQINITGIYSDGVFATGEQLLNGTQATAYSRIRSTDQGDITRTERQREVLSKMIAKAKASDLKTIDAMIDDIFPNICTSLSESQMIDLAASIKEYELSSTVGFPFAWAPVDHATKGSIIVPADLEQNVSALHEYLFGTADYVPTQHVRDICAVVRAETGVAPQEVTINTYVAPE